MTIGRGGLRPFDKLRDRGFPFLRHLQEVGQVNLPSIWTDGVRRVLLWLAHVAADDVGDRPQIGLAGLGMTEPLGRAPTTAERDGPPGVDEPGRGVELRGSVPAQDQGPAKLRDHANGRDVAQKRTQLCREARTMLLKLIEVSCSENETARGGAVDSRDICSLGG